ncbi:hypothetical protein H4R19_006452 [Coemansia spiralis]|nr:hypothetical protein H4R19_006452 [Coemansia spiralis]
MPSSENGSVPDRDWPVGSIRKHGNKARRWVAEQPNRAGQGGSGISRDWPVAVVDTSAGPGYY